ncbi:MAG: type II secretion system protein [Nitrospina sp.]|jgi:prepilin-type N-terminal cleavage/methylation domain-containing protein|nr:type II secretion system protein [Nitrospina sp.]MBT3416303.1 type II secretion system protein [Nitrospina sp.]MBT3856726.1 type II secretion system protein [Nitrospina sp.]MBT4105371.1 type II secretion system protein [Nitrospina sp.]MBT4390637.1 type II secretion system protein [Nitrospina sp.]
MIQIKKPCLRRCLLARESGFTLVEIILAIVVIGIAIPSIMIPFSQLEDTKRPELTVQASFLALKHIESIASKTRNVSPCAGITVTSEEGYTITCAEINVASTDLDTDTGATSFAKKVTLTITHPEIVGDLKFFTLFALDA